VKNFVPAETKFIKINCASKGNLVPDFNAYTKDLTNEGLNMFVINLSEQVGVPLKYSDEICISNYDINPVALLSRLCFTHEECWNVL
jgi:hypothetical protein